MKTLVKRLLGIQAASPMVYEEHAYWNQRHDPNSPEGWEDAHLRMTVEYIREHTKDSHHVLELGPGVGRTLEAHPPGRKVTGYDISTLYRDRIKERARELGIDFTLDIASSDNGVLPYGDHAFDVGVSSQVFLHQRPERIEKMMREMARVCVRVVVVTGGYRISRRAAHVFDHDYPAITTVIGCEMNHVRAWPPHLFFVYEARSD